MSLATTGLQCISIKLTVPKHIKHSLDDMLHAATACVKRMLKDRSKKSTSYYKEIPSVIAKSLINKYQRNRRCKSVTNMVLPICGDKGQQVKIETNGIRIPCLFKKQVIPVVFRHPPVSHIRSCELFKRRGEWFISLQYDTVVEGQRLVLDAIGVDRNSRGNVAVIASVLTGKVRKLGPDAGGISNLFRLRKAKLQKLGKTRLLKKLSGKQRRRTKDINHKVSRSIVDYAQKTSSAIVLEDLSQARSGKIRGYVERSQWSFFQLEQFIRYKAVLSGVPVVCVAPHYTSQICSMCGELNKPSGKQYRCKCGHVEHRDVNAAFNIAQRFHDSNGISSANTVRRVGAPQAGQCNATAHVGGMSRCKPEFQLPRKHQVSG